jgi:hypothetical protein
MCIMETNTRENIITLKEVNILIIKPINLKMLEANYSLYCVFNILPRNLTNPAKVSINVVL